MSLFQWLLDIIYPPRCPICKGPLSEAKGAQDRDSISFCHACQGGFHMIESPFCPICGIPHRTGLTENHTCEDCLRKRPLFEALAAPFQYEGPLMTAIHRFKYGARSHLGKALGPLCARFAGEWLGHIDHLLVVPVPLHPKRLRERGFNQSLILARHVASRLNAELDFLSLRRQRYTPPQTRLRKTERVLNVKGAFHIKEEEAFTGRTILLIDDVATTGNTLNECARVLLQGGAERVICLVLARAAPF